MRSEQTCDRISLTEVRKLVEEYETHLPQHLAELDEKRYVKIPEAVAARKTQAFLTKNELLDLVSWKLKHGTYRPRLLNLVSSNAELRIIDTTRAAFSHKSEHGIASGALNGLTMLSGIGPATASLILSVYDPSGVAFFSDELFRYLHCTAHSDGSVRGWDRKIKYNRAEYDYMMDKLGEMTKRIRQESGVELSCSDIEKAAYVLGNPAFSNPEIHAKKLEGGPRTQDEGQDSKEKSDRKGTKKRKLPKEVLPSPRYETRSGKRRAE